MVTERKCSAEIPDESDNSHLKPPANHVPILTGSTIDLNVAMADSAAR
jgi:hypothetical protein